MSISGEDIEVEETKLPGIGLRHDFMTRRGRRVGVVSHRNGRRDLVLYDPDDPDACISTLVLSSDEADTLAEFLGARRITERLANLNEQVSSLHTDRLRVANGSRYDGLRLGDTHARTRTGSSIVAVVRKPEAFPSPDPDFVLHGGDVLIVVGTAEGIAGLAEILAE
ncbi:cation:proton antiporter regulatory subunit [Fodinicola acaciae]|uniref:cation:proton antiporter regulatory subunit n=1 Tax=Fodinicola acaciae TaxID=2681555 RepID=UPI0013D57774|nr:cation:proton antiporter regulatory subunit [Fodinicola acaciae]